MEAEKEKLPEEKLLFAKNKWLIAHEELVKGRMFHVKHSPFVRVCRLLMDGMYNNN